MSMKRFLVLVVFAVPCLVSQSSGQALGLEDVIRAVCAKSDSTKMMKETMRKSDQMIREQWAAAWPKVSGMIYAGRTHPTIGHATTISMSMPDTSRHQDALLDMELIGGMMGQLTAAMKPKEMEVYSTSIQITQPIYTFGKVGAAVKVAADFDSSVHESYKRNIQNLQLTALDAFYTALLLDKQVSVNEKSLARKTEYASFLERNFSMGSGVRAPMLMARSDVKSQEASLITLREAAVSTKMYINLFLGRAVTDPLLLDTASTLPTLSVMEIPSAEDALVVAAANRGDLNALEYMRKANEGGAKIFRAMYLPTIAASASAGTSATAFKNVVDRDYGNWSVGVAMQWMFFDGFASSAKAAQYASDARKIEIVKNFMDKKLETDIRTAVQECVSADTNLTAMHEAYAAALEGYTLTAENFMSGSGQLVELQRSEEQLRQSEMGLFQAQYRKARSRAALIVAMGNDIVKLEEK